MSATERLKHLADIRVSNVDKKSIDSEMPVRLCNYTHVYYNERITADLDFMSATATFNQRSVFGLRRGDVIITKDSETADDIGVGAVVDADCLDLVCGYHLAVIRAKRNRAFGPFLKWALASSAIRQQMAAAATGVTRFGLRSEAIADIAVPEHPVARQRAIAVHLDRETARIDALIAAKQKMIELLREQSEAVVAALVTTRPESGHDSRVASEWLGRTPNGWRVMPLKRLAQCDNSGAWGQDQGSRDVDLPVATTAQVGVDGTFRVAAMPVRSFSRAEVARYRCRPGEILVVKSSGSATSIVSGKAGRITRDTPAFIFSNFLMRIRVDPKVVLPEFLYAFLTSRITRERVKRMVSATTYPNLRVDEYMSSAVPVPGLNEQQQIVHRLAAHSLRLATSTDALSRSIALLTERRQALITAAVTGQLDMPEAA